ncbi:MAG TPA: patatin-like phospholipase family protein [Chitinophagaceae bacterium]|nr:patatin-like phospholipase family protein [Chitinophagaceae bacterium]
MAVASHYVLRFISRLLKSLWLFFPGILFLFLAIFFFWLLGQGKDIIVAFTENRSRTLFSLNYTRVIFFLAIGFWVYVSWYSSRIIAYIKKSKEEDKVQEITGVDRKAAATVFKSRRNYFDITNNFLELFPRVIGHSCFLVLELAVLQSPVLLSPISSTAAVIIFLVALIILYFINRWIQDKQASKPMFRKAFWVLLIVFIVLIIVVSFFKKISILALLALLILMHVVFLFYINLRRLEVEENKDSEKIPVDREEGQYRSVLVKLMDYFCVPRKEKGYFKWYLIIGVLGVIFYLAAINSLSFARGIGPFPFIILAFGVLLAFGNIVTAFSVRFSVNFHFLLFILAFVLGMGETHYVRTLDLDKNVNEYALRPSLQTYLTAWLRDRNVAGDTASNGYDIYFVMANGGASRSGYWTAGVLGKIEDSSLVNAANRFSDHVFCLSGTSGGGVGVATFFSLLRNKEQRWRPLYNESARAFLKQDYFTFTFARMLGPDFFNYIFHLSNTDDRAAALEKSFEESARKSDTAFIPVPFYEPLSSFPAMQNGKVYLPILCVNTTRMQDGNPGLVTNLKLEPSLFNNRVDVLRLLQPDVDISITSGSILGARFPYLSPAGRIGDNYFVDGGYFDNSGAGVVQEMIRGIINIGRQDSIINGSTGELYKGISKLHFKVLHIVNSPIDLDSANIKKVAPIKNDLLAPILTIVGAYDMQTTVNDARLINFIKDVNNYSGNRADYTLISLYDDAEEWKKNPLNKRFKKDPPYAMNWFMSDTTLHRINKRLNSNRKLDSLIASMKLIQVSL